MISNINNKAEKAQCDLNASLGNSQSIVGASKREVKPEKCTKDVPGCFRFGIDLIVCINF